MLKKPLITIFSLVVVFAGIAASVSASGAAKDFDFGSCLNPQVKASQVNKGDRFGVVGTVKLYSGTDSIYNFSNGNVMQCLCQKNGKGIQTNWLKINSMSKKEVDSMKNSGWTYIITGSTWGLSDVPYLAKNADYSCNGTSIKDTEVKGLAATGNSIAIYGLVFAGIVSLAVGLFIKRKARNV